MKLRHASTAGLGRNSNRVHTAALQEEPNHLARSTVGRIRKHTFLPEGNEIVYSGALLSDHDPGNTDLGCPKSRVPTWKHYESFTEQMKSREV